MRLAASCRSGTPLRYAGTLGCQRGWAASGPHPRISVRVAAGAWRRPARFRDRTRPIPRHGTTAYERRRTARLIALFIAFAIGSRAVRHDTAAPRVSLGATLSVSIASPITVRQVGLRSRPRFSLASDPCSRRRRSRSISHSPEPPPRLSSTHGFNRVAPCVSSSAAGATRPRRNLSVITNNRVDPRECRPGPRRRAGPRWPSRSALYGVVSAPLPKRPRRSS